MPASIVFLEHGAVISAEVDAPQVDKNTPFQQCAHALMKYCPQGFQTKVEHSSKSQKAKMEVTVCASLVDEIPLLSDIRSSTPAHASKKRRKTGDATEKRDSFDSQCSILALISVLLLHEQLVKVDGWLGDLSRPENRFGNPELGPMFAVETLQMADFLGMKGVRTQVVGWFQTLLLNLAKAEREGLRRPDTTDRPVDSHKMASLMHITQVLASIVQPQFCSELFADLAGHVTADKPCFVDLPEEVVCMWLRCQGPTLDFSDFTLNSHQCVKFLHCIVLVHPKLTTLRMRYSITNGLERPGYVLQGVYLACACLRGLKVLEFKKFPILASHVPILARIFGSVSGSLEELCIGGLVFPTAAGKGKYRTYDLKATQMFFEAIAKLKKLRVLKMHAWKDFIRAGAGAPPEDELSVLYDEEDLKLLHEEQKSQAEDMKQIMLPLLGLPDLQEVQVPEVDESLPFTVEPRLKFTEATF